MSELRSVYEVRGIETDTFLVQAFCRAHGAPMRAAKLDFHNNASRDDEN